ncbi:MAG TPA: shikimate dehydrogenase [Pseudomonadales bacterium]|nr:shikimate dehydrogenase [Pseudomonadales bacterium]
MDVANYAVMGNPIAHSKSPIIHAEFAKQLGEAIRYERMLVPLDGFPQAVSAFFNAGGLGLNITVPFKEEAWKISDVRSKRAEKAGAVNTLMLAKSGKIHGDTTDGVGLVRDIKDNHHGLLRGARILVLGAGGAVRGVLQPLLQEQPAEIVIANRTVEKADFLAQLFAEEGPVKAASFAALEGPFDWIINGTSASLGGELPPLPQQIISPRTHCYDMMYGKGLTPFNAWAQQQGAAETIDGLGMLVEQAAESYFIWRNKRPNTQPVLAMLRGL